MQTNNQTDRETIKQRTIIDVRTKKRPNKALEQVGGLNAMNKLTMTHRTFVTKLDRWQRNYWQNHNFAKM